MGDRPAVVIRAVAFEVEETAAVQAGSSPDLTGALRVIVQLKELRVHRLGFLVQKPPDRAAEPVWEPVLEPTSAGSETLCRFHEKIDGSEFYCAKPSSTRAGYCWEHASSWRALYERCAQGDDKACSEAGGLAPGEFAVYALDYGGRRLKVGLTQLQRFLWRVAEQPHISAVVLASGALTAMRDLERSLGGRLGATQGAGERLEDRLQSSSRAAALSLSEAARRLADMLASLGLRGSFEAVQLKPRILSVRDFLSEPSALSSLFARRLRLLDYWAGILAFEDVDNGERLLLDKWELFHRLLHAKLAESAVCSPEPHLSAPRRA